MSAWMASQDKRGKFVELMEGEDEPSNRTSWTACIDTRAIP